MVGWRYFLADSGQTCFADVVVQRHWSLVGFLEDLQMLGLPRGMEGCLDLHMGYWLGSGDCRSSWHW